MSAAASPSSPVLPWVFSPPEYSLFQDDDKQGRNDNQSMCIITASPTVPAGCPGSLEAPSTTPSSGLAAPQLRNAGQLRPLGILSWGGPGNVRGLQRGVLGRRVGPNRGQSPSSLRLQVSRAPKLKLIGAQLERELANHGPCERSTCSVPPTSGAPPKGKELRPPRVWTTGSFLRRLWGPERRRK